MFTKCLKLDSIATGYAIKVTEENAPAIIKRFRTRKGGWQGQVSIHSIFNKEGKWNGLLFKSKGTDIIISENSIIVFRNDKYVFNEDTFEIFSIFYTNQAFLSEYILIEEIENTEVKLHRENLLYKFISSLNLTQSELDILWKELSLENEVLRWLLSYNITWRNFPIPILEKMGIKEKLLIKEKNNREELDKKLDALRNTIEEYQKEIEHLEKTYAEERILIRNEEKQEALDNLIQKLFKGEYLTQLEIKELLDTFPYKCQDSNGYPVIMDGIINLHPDYFQVDNEYKNSVYFAGQPHRVYKEVAELQQGVFFSEEVPKEPLRNILFPFNNNIIIPFLETEEKES